MKKFFEELIARKTNEINALQNRGDASTDINEVRSIARQIAGLNAEITEARAQLDALNAQTPETQEPDGDNLPVLDNNTRSRNVPAPRVVASAVQRNGVPNSAETRAREFANTGRMTVTNTETRAALVSGGKIATPTEVGGIHDAFTQVSDIVDLVTVTDCTGMGAYKVAYEIASGTAAKQTEGAAVAESDMTFDYVTITPETAAIMSLISKQVKRQSPLNYRAKVEKNALVALRKYASKLIVTKAKASALTEKKTITAIDADTLRKLALGYGGAEGVEGSATLVLNKDSLVKFGDVRGTQEKKAVYEITPDATNPNGGVIRDGGLSVRYCINSNLGADELLYGNLRNFELGLFGDYEVAVSEERNIDKLMLTVVGDADMGGAVVVNKGLIFASKAAG